LCLLTCNTAFAQVRPNQLEIINSTGKRVIFTIWRPTQVNHYSVGAGRSFTRPLDTSTDDRVLIASEVQGQSAFASPYNVLDTTAISTASSNMTTISVALVESGGEYTFIFYVAGGGGRYEVVSQSIEQKELFEEKLEDIKQAEAN